jgi:probable F420-dependent oxidoreductase
VHIGVSAQSTDRTLDAATIARTVEAAGIESVFFGEHTHIPAARQTPYPGGDGTLPAGYERTIDLVVALTMAAQVTTDLRLGTGIWQVVQRDPIIAAKAIASVDHMSNGRMVLITGSSWNLEEMRNHGTDPETRYELLEERVLAMREIWSQDEASYHGRFVDFDRIWSWPKPVQDPFPVFVGGNSPGSEERAMRVGTGWSPIHTPGMVDRVRAFVERTAADGRPFPVMVVGGELSAELIESYSELGVERWVHGLGIPETVAELEGRIEQLLAVRAEFLGAA